VIDQIKVRTLIIVGDQDVAIVPAKAERMHKRIPNSEMVGIPGAGHTSTDEEPKAVTAAMSEFLNKQGS
jgi:3-oxoadipate enol-lactonase